MRNRYKIYPLLAALLIGAAPAPVTAPPPALNLDPFYTRYLEAAGIPIVSSARVPDEALRRAQAIVVAMLAHRPELARALVARGQRVAVMAPDEGTVDLPEQRDWKKPTRDDPRLTVCEAKHYEARIGRLSDRDYWNARARGMGGVLTSGATENLLGSRSSRYYGENIFVHEFSHSILNAIEAADPKLFARVRAAYDHALGKGMWKGEYAAVSIDEYWAEGTQFWFNTNKVTTFDRRVILSDRDLRRYDPRLYRVLAATYGKDHRLAADAFYMSPARVPPGPLPKFTAEVC
ncbi:glycoside hydrolase [Sphingomonas hylomeconis]|uniref:Glycoside hydrolase n=1 Tax=Sphingomonas hylomeconis TaxID=1395958 RepID=A0ABV7SSS8_9SPHN|nr:glycoside hydrolase [Sphingomonas hylomeconis]